MSPEFIARLIGMIVFSILGVYGGSSIGQLANAAPGSSTFSIELYAFIFGMVGALVGLVLTPFITIRPYRAVRSILSRLDSQSLVAALVGLTVGLIIAALLAFPLSLLPAPFRNIMPFIGVLLFGYLGVSVFVMRRRDIFSMFSAVSQRGGSQAEKGVVEGGELAGNRTILLDTSVIIDGRIADIARTGFVPGSLLIPRFVLAELQYIADSADGLRRQRGRRGMEVLSQLQKEPGIPCA
jgi:uncharacterized protein YacL